MHLATPRIFATTLVLIVSVLSTAAQEGTVILTSDQGATAVFNESGDTGGRWSWTELSVPGATVPQGISVRRTPIVSSEGEATLEPEWTLVEQQPNQLVFEQEAPSAGLSFRRVFSFGPAPNSLRIGTWARALQGTRVIRRAGLLDVRVLGEDFSETGAAPASFPLFGHNFFVGIEHVSGTASADGERVYLSQAPYVTVGEDWQFIAHAVIGWPTPTNCTLVTPDNRVRLAFYQYLDTIRVKPADFELHTNTWWTLPLPFSEADVLKDVNALAAGFRDRTGMFFDSFALDLGWSDPRSIWRVDAKRFPNEFRAINDRLGTLGARMGLWVSPGSAYPPGLDNKWLESAGYEVSPFPLDDLPKVACFALGGRYQREFRENLLSLVRTYGIRHVKLDFMAHTCNVATHGHPVGIESAYAIDAGLADVLDSLRAVNPNIVLEPLCTGYPPSPWWVTKTPYVLGPYGDDVPYGRVPSPEWMESLISARDIAYRADRERWVMPTPALETIDVVLQSPGDFENLAVMAIGRGRWFISTYLKPDLMTPKNWDFLAALMRWARANKQYLDNGEMIGGDPSVGEAYGTMFHHDDKDIYCARNPWIEQREIELPVCGSVQEPRLLRMIYPRRELVARLEPGEPAPRLLLAPYETVMLETIPAGDTGDPTAWHPQPQADVSAEPPAVTIREGDPERKQASNVNFQWSGTITMPEVTGGELCLLIEGAAQVNNTNATVLLDHRTARATVSASAGQFGAAASPSPENWKWFIVPITTGTHTVEIALDVPLNSASIGVFLRGSTPAGNAEAPADGPVFPVYHPELRGWSQTLVPLQPHPAPEPEVQPESDPANT